jgi:glycopeptide antibiotics resistance protein
VIDWGAVRDGLTWPATLTVVALTLMLAWPLGRRRGVTGVLFVVVVGLVLAATATTGVLALSTSGLRPYLAAFADPGVLFGGFAGNLERLANIGLFLPLGLLGTLLWRRPLWVATGCLAFSFLIETWQDLNGRGGDAVDVVHNTAGALLGVLLARGWTNLASQGTV